MPENLPADQRAALDRAVDVLDELENQPQIDGCVRVGHSMVSRKQIREAREFIGTLAWHLWSEEPK